MTRTPLRVSLVGGGTDLPAFYRREGGAVLSTTIDRYVYVTVKRHSELFFEPVRVNYSRSEQVERTCELDNNIARECLRFVGVDPPVYISTVGDVPASTGLGGSSAFAVGLLNALHSYKGERASAGQLAEEACHIEIDVLGARIGKQDQYAAAYGGLNLLSFKPDGGVTVEHLRIPGERLRELFQSVLMFWTGHQRDASAVLSEQDDRTDLNLDSLRRMRDQARDLHRDLGAGEIDIEGIGRLLDRGWRMKRELAGSIVRRPSAGPWATFSNCRSVTNPTARSSWRRSTMVRAAKPVADSMFGPSPHLTRRLRHTTHFVSFYGAAS